jgi:hypothetical protein
VVLVAVLGDRHAFDQVHDEERPAGVGRAGVKHARNVRVIHQGQSLAFGFEASDDLFRVHPCLYQFDGDDALDRVSLLGHPNRSHASFTDRFQELVRPNHRASAFTRWLIRGDCRGRRAGLQKRTHLLVMT